MKINNRCYFNLQGKTHAPTKLPSWYNKTNFAQMIYNDKVEVRIDICKHCGCIYAEPVSEPANE